MPLSDRSSFPCALFPLVLTFVILLGWSCGSAVASQPNVLFIAVDDLNDWVGCFDGHPNAQTPNIDRLASRGVLFSNAHCQAPICGPSRASVMTGMLPTTTGIYGQISDKNLREASDATRRAVFLPDYFERFGYKTLACGKLFHNGDRAKVFDEYGGQASFGPKPEKRFQYDPAWFPEKIGSTQTDWGAFPESDDEMPDFRIAQYGVQQLASQHQQPFFLALGFMRPHVPWYVPQKWFDEHPIEGVKLPPYLESDLTDVSEMSRRVNAMPAMPSTEWAIEEKQWEAIVQSYLACTTFVDAQIGKVLDALDQSPYRDNTIVVFWSDHGYHVGEKNRFAKQALWDRATRVPMIISIPEQKAAARCDRAVGLIDMYPTLLELCDLPANSDNEGTSLVPLLNAPQSEWDVRTITTHGRGNHAVQSGHLRFYQYEDGSTELYDHSKDPNEWTNLASRADAQKTVQRLRQVLPSVEATPSQYNKYPTNRYFLDRYPESP